MSSKEELINHIDSIMMKYLQIQQSVKDSSNVELSIQEVKIISYLGKNETSRMRDLSNYLNLQMSTMTGIIDKLVQKRFVERIRTDEDRRTVRVKLTLKGKKIFNIEVENHLELSQQMLNSLTMKEQKTLLSLLNKIVTNIK